MPDVDDDCAVTTLAVVLLKLLLVGVWDAAPDNVPPLNKVVLPKSDESREEPPMLPVNREMYTVLPLLDGLDSRRENVADVKPSTTKAEAEPVRLNKLPALPALVSGGAEMSGVWTVLVICT